MASSCAELFCLMMLVTPPARGLVLATAPPGLLPCRCSAWARASASNLPPLADLGISGNMKIAGLRDCKNSIFV